MSLSVSILSWATAGQVNPGSDLCVEGFGNG